MDEMDQNEELFRAWIGNKRQDAYYNRMKNGGFDWLAFFYSRFTYAFKKDVSRNNNFNNSSISY